MQNTTLSIKKNSVFKTLYSLFLWFFLLREPMDSETKKLKKKYLTKCIDK